MEICTLSQVWDFHIDLLVAPHPLKTLYYFLNISRSGEQFFTSSITMALAFPLA